MDEKQGPEPDEYDEDEVRENSPDEYCPRCGKEYDDIDFDYQICRHCNFNNDKVHK